MVFDVDFTNSVVKPFPAGLNDCMAALEHVYRHKHVYNIDKIVLEGESGGGNLVLAMNLEMKRLNKLHLVDGTFANAPFIVPSAEEEFYSQYPSLVENEGIIFSRNFLQHFVYAYTPNLQYTKYSWPGLAKVEDLVGLKPHVIHVGSLDTLRDEGVEYARKLIKANVDARAVVDIGATHGIEGTTYSQHYILLLNNIRIFVDYVSSL